MVRDMNGDIVDYAGWAHAHEEALNMLKMSGDLGRFMKHKNANPIDRLWYYRSKMVCTSGAARMVGKMQLFKLVKFVPPLWVSPPPECPHVVAKFDYRRASDGDIPKHDWLAKGMPYHDGKPAFLVKGTQWSEWEFYEQEMMGLTTLALGMFDNLRALVKALGIPEKWLPYTCINSIIELEPYVARHLPQRTSC